MFILGNIVFWGGLSAIEWWRIDRQERREGLKPINPRRHQEITPEQWEQLEAFAASKDHGKPA